MLWGGLGWGLCICDLLHQVGCRRFAEVHVEQCFLGGCRYVPVWQNELSPCPWQVHECVSGQSVGGGRQAEEQLGFLHRPWASLAGRYLLQNVQGVNERVWWHGPGQAEGLKGTCPNVPQTRMTRPLLFALRV